MHKEKSLCPTFVCGCPLIFIENLVVNPLTFHYIKVFWSIAVSVSQRILCMRHSHLSKTLWTSNTLNLLVPLQPLFCRCDKNCNACGEALLTSRSCTGSMSVMLWESILQIQYVSSPAQSINLKLLPAHGKDNRATLNRIIHTRDKQTGTPPTWGCQSCAGASSLFPRCNIYYGYCHYRSALTQQSWRNLSASGKKKSRFYLAYY